MDAQTMDLVKRSAQASVMYAAIAGVGLVIVNLLSKVPFLGILFACLYVLGWIAIAGGIGYLTAPKISPLPLGQTKSMIALWIGLGVAIPLTIALVIASLIGRIFDLFTGSHSLIGGIFTLIGAVVLGLIGGLLICTALAWLGSYFGLDRNPNLATATQMPQQPQQPF